MLLLEPVDHRGISYVVGTAVRHGKRRDVFFRYRNKHHRKPVVCPFDVNINKGVKQVTLELSQSCLGDDAGTLKVDALTEDLRGGDLDYLTKAVKVEQG